MNPSAPALADGDGQARDFILGLDLPDAPPQLEAAEGVSIEYGSTQEAVAVGAQIAEFSAQVSPQAREAVADSMLLAQLAATKATAGQTDPLAWHQKYVDTLKAVGWLVQSLEFTEQSVNDSNLGVHNAIIPVLTGMLGPAVAAASVVVSVLKGLQEMDKDNPWITLFDRASQHASGAKFQLSFVDADEQGNPRIQLMALTIDAQRSVTQVLFFKFSDQSARLRKAETALSASLTRLQSIQAAVSSKVQPFLLDNISKIEI